MFVGWIRSKALKQDLELFEADQVIDKNLILTTYEANPEYCFAIYEGEVLKGLVTVYPFENCSLINNLYYARDVKEEDKHRLITLLLQNIDPTSTLLVLVNQTERKLFQAFGFESYAPFSHAIFNGGGVAFNFSSTTAKSISQENYQSTLKKLDLRAWSEDRYDYILHGIAKQSSLMLSNDFGYQHSYMLSKGIVKLSPWIMESDALSDAEKFIRGVIYHRGLKKIIAFVPQIKEITDLYESYRFEVVGGYYLLYLGNKPSIDLEMIYGL